MSRTPSADSEFRRGQIRVRRYGVVHSRSPATTCHTARGRNPEPGPSWPRDQCRSRRSRSAGQCSGLRRKTPREPRRGRPSRRADSPWRVAAARMAVPAHPRSAGSRHRNRHPALLQPLGLQPCWPRQSRCVQDRSFPPPFRFLNQATPPPAPARNQSLRIGVDQASSTSKESGDPNEPLGKVDSRRSNDFSRDCAKRMRDQHGRCL